MSGEDDADRWNLLPAIRLLHSISADAEAASLQDGHHLVRSTGLTDGPSDFPVRTATVAKPEEPDEATTAICQPDPRDGGETDADEEGRAQVQRRQALRDLLLKTLENAAGEKRALRCLDLQRHGLEDDGQPLSPPVRESGVQLQLPDLSVVPPHASSPFGSPTPTGFSGNGIFVPHPSSIPLAFSIYQTPNHVRHIDFVPTSSSPYLSISLRPEVRPLEIRSSADRKAQLVTKLVSRFPKERKYLLRLPSIPSAYATDSIDEVHVFVDFSNILIGFFDTIKKIRGIPLKTRTRAVPFSFHSLALILERGRPVAKRILAGSTPLVPAVTEAERCGYEVSILEKVMKVARVRQSPLRLRTNGATTGTSGASSSSDTPTGPQRLVEQAVDEILHLKILESLVDASAPSTIVLASGDAAEAEYSAGFFKMVERALEKGWKVELVSFAKTMSYAYRNQAFVNKWRKQFRTIMLDAYTEELLDI